MTDYFSIAPGSSTYTTTSYLPGMGAAGYNNYGTETVTTTTNTSTPVVNTQVLGTGVETNFGTNTADGYFGGGQAAVNSFGVAAESYGAGTYFGGDSSQVVTTSLPATSTYAETSVAAAPTYQNYDYQDYSSGLYGYAEPPKKKSLFNLRNILLGCLGLLLLGGLLGGLLWALKRFRKPSLPIVTPAPQPLVPAPILRPGPTTVLIRRDGYSTTPMVLPTKPQSNIITAPTPRLIEVPAPVLKPQVTQITQIPQVVQLPQVPQVAQVPQVIQLPQVPQVTQVAQVTQVPQFSQEQMNAAIQAAIQSGALIPDDNFESAVRSAFRPYFSSDEQFSSALATALQTAAPSPASLPTLSAADLQQLSLIAGQTGGISPSVLTQLGLTPETFELMLKQAVSSGVADQTQLAQLGLLPGDAGFVNSISQAAARVGNVASNAFGRITGRA